MVSERLCACAWWQYESILQHPLYQAEHAKIDRQIEARLLEESLLLKKQSQTQTNRHTQTTPPLHTGHGDEKWLRPWPSEVYKEQTVRLCDLVITGYGPADCFAV